MIVSRTAQGNKIFHTDLEFIQHEVSECKKETMSYEMYKGYMGQWGFEDRFTVSEQQYNNA